jgi:negative regulator of sigma E activity
MKKCLDEATLQSYFDGELSTDLMESATSHLASCTACSAAARELEQENALLTTALAAEFDAAVPTEQLRMRINAAVANLNAPLAAQKSGFFGSFAKLFNFAPQQALAYGGLIVVLAFALVFGIVKMKSNNAPQIAETPNSQSSGGNTAVATTKPDESSIPPVVTNSPAKPEKPLVQRVDFTPRRVVPKPAPVKLLPGERSYLQTIARLDSAIKAEKKAMRPGLQVEYERNLAVVDRAIAATRTAAKSNPNDPDAADFMFSAYQSKVDLLNTIADARVGGRSH